MHLDFSTLFTGGMGALLLSAAARALPEPAATGNPIYGWVYRFTHLLLANFDKAAWPHEDQPSGN